MIAVIIQKDGDFAVGDLISDEEVEGARRVSPGRFEAWMAQGFCEKQAADPLAEDEAAGPAAEKKEPPAAKKKTRRKSRRRIPVPQPLIHEGLEEESEP